MASHWQKQHIDELIAAMSMGMSEKDARRIIIAKYELTEALPKRALRDAMTAANIPIRRQDRP